MHTYILVHKHVQWICMFICITFNRYLSWNRIDALHPETFRSQNNLREIHLAGNQLVIINPRVFNDIYRLQLL